MKRALIQYGLGPIRACSGQGAPEDAFQCEVVHGEIAAGKGPFREKQHGGIRLARWSSPCTKKLSRMNPLYPSGSDRKPNCHHASACIDQQRQAESESHLQVTSDQALNEDHVGDGIW